jgi:hypothetical protein
VGSDAGDASAASFFYFLVFSVGRDGSRGVMREMRRRQGYSEKSFSPLVFFSRTTVCGKVPCEYTRCGLLRIFWQASAGRRIFEIFHFSEFSDRRVPENKFRFFLLHFSEFSIFFFDFSEFSDRQVPEDEFSYVIAIDMCARAAGKGGRREGGGGWVEEAYSLFDEAVERLRPLQTVVPHNALMKVLFIFNFYFFLMTRWWRSWYVSGIDETWILFLLFSYHGGPDTWALTQNLIFFFL